MTRVRLPNRRICVTRDIEWITGTGEVMRITLGIGFDAAGRVKEVFADTNKVGSDFQATLSDGCVFISHALQHGVPLAPVAPGLLRVPAAVDTGETRPASPLGAIVKAVLAEEAGHD